MQDQHVQSIRCAIRLDRVSAPTQAHKEPELNLLRGVLATVDEGIVVQGADGAIVLCNAAAERILGMNADQLCGLTSMDRCWEAVRADGSPCPGEEHPASVALRTGVLIPATIMGVNVGTGERRWLLSNARPLFSASESKPYAVVVSFTDITVLQQQEADRRRAQLQADRFFTLALDLMCIATPEARFLRVNPAWTKTLGWSEEELLANPFLDLVHPEDLAKTQAEVAHLARGGVTIHFENRYRCKDGGWRHLLWSAVLEPDEGVIIAAARDLTALREREEALRCAKEAAEAADRAKSEFLATVSHEIRTPMNGVLGMTEVLLGMALRPDQEELVRIIRNSGQGLLAILNDILDFSKLEAGRMELEALPFSPADVGREVIALLSAQAAHKGLSLSLELADAPACLLGDAARLRQVLFNLVGNAIKFTERGSVVVRIGRCASGAGLPHGGCVVEVADTGIGIAAEHHGKLFRRFSQLDASTTRRYGGSGLGLAICLRLVEAMGGTLTLDSVAGRGSSFRVTLPTVVAPMPVMAPAKAADSVPEAVRPLKVLLVEDNPVNQNVARRLLSRQGHDVHTAGNGCEALVAFALRRWDLILMDVQMPEMDGLEATRAIRERELAGALPRTPVVGLTASVFQGDRAACLAAGMDDVLPKPITGAVLAAALARWA